MKCALWTSGLHSVSYPYGINRRRGNFIWSNITCASFISWWPFFFAYYSKNGSLALALFANHFFRLNVSIDNSSARRIIIYILILFVFAEPLFPPFFIFFGTLKYFGLHLFLKGSFSFAFGTNVWVSFLLL